MNEPNDLPVEPETQPPLIPSVPVPSPSTPTPEPSGVRKIGHIIAGTRVRKAVLGIIVILLIAGGTWYISHRASTKAGNNTASITIANEKIPPASCATAQSLIGKQSIDGDECYIAKFNVGSEPIHYVIIKQSAAYQQKQASQCQLDCGGSIPTTRSDYIVRADGKVQFTLPDWTQPAEPDIDELTGCGDGNFGILKTQSGQASFVQDNGDIGLYVTAQNVSFSDQFGDNCSVAFKLTQDITNDLSATTGLSIAQLKVHYSLNPVSSCQQQSGSKMYECYQDQAIMRNDLSMCSMTVDPSDPNDGDTSCITDIAERRQDPSVCTMIQPYGNIAWVSQSVYNSNVQNCETTSGQLKDVLTQKLIVD
jgi:hypothetical protein